MIFFKLVVEPKLLNIICRTHKERTKSKGVPSISKIDRVMAIFVGPGHVFYSNYCIIIISSRGALRDPPTLLEIGLRLFVGKFWIS